MNRRWRAWRDNVRRGISLWLWLGVLVGWPSVGRAEAPAVSHHVAYVVYTEGASAVRHPDGTSEAVAVGQVLRPGGFPDRQRGGVRRSLVRPDV